MIHQAKIPVFFSPHMVPVGMDTFSPSARKPGLVVDSWASKFPIAVHDVTPATRAQMNMAHRYEYVRKVLACEERNGFGNLDSRAAKSFPYTTGAMLSAARWAVLNKGFAAAPCSGFHHAGYSSGGGFCTFNGLMVAAMALKFNGLVQKVGILDCDMHYGNGTDQIIEHTKSEPWVQHFTQGRKYVNPEQADGYLKDILPRVLSSMVGCDLVIYQAGADPHISDPLGGFMTTEQLRQRDEMVFNFFALTNTPVAWNLAGGYQVEKDGSIPKVLEIHDNTMSACVKAVCP